jgi:hypothetical protein
VSVLRFSRPGIVGTTLVDLGPNVGRVQHTRGAITGGTIVVGGLRGRTVAQSEAAEKRANGAAVSSNAAAARRYYERNKELILERQRAARAAERPPCRKWMIIARQECARSARHHGACSTRDSMERDRRAG